MMIESLNKVSITLAQATCFVTRATQSWISTVRDSVPVTLRLLPLRSSRKIISALFSQTLDWVSFIGGHITVQSYQKIGIH
eukprot:1765114-Amphidinium_carterae.1